MKQYVSVGVFGIVKDKQNKVLLCLRTDKDFWNLPGGGMELGEKTQETLVREVYDETGLRTKAKNLVGVFEKTHKYEIVFVYECEILSGKLTLNDEAKDLRYFSPNALPTNIFKSHKSRIEELTQKKSDVVTRVESKEVEERKSAQTIIDNLISIYEPLGTAFFTMKEYLKGTKHTSNLLCSQKTLMALEQLESIHKGMLALMEKEIEDHCIMSTITKNYKN